MGLHDPFEYLKHKLWPKEGPGIKLAIWVPTTKSRQSSRFPCVQVVCHIPWKSLDKGYNFTSDLISIGGQQKKLWAPKVARVPSLGILGLPLGSPGTKWHLDVSLLERHIVYYKREGGGFPQVQAMVSLVGSSLPMIPPNTKSAPIMH
jgi:hypothetical protein